MKAKKDAEDKERERQARDRLITEHKQEMAMLNKDLMEITKLGIQSRDKNTEALIELKTLIKERSQIVRSSDRIGGGGDKDVAPKKNRK